MGILEMSLLSALASPAHMFRAVLREAPATDSNSPSDFVNSCWVGPPHFFFRFAKIFLRNCSTETNNTNVSHSYSVVITHLMSSKQMRCWRQSRLSNRSFCDLIPSLSTTCRSVLGHWTLKLLPPAGQSIACHICHYSISVWMSESGIIAKNIYGLDQKSAISRNENTELEFEDQ